MSYIPKEHIDKFYEKNEKYRKYYIKKVQQYLLIDFTILSVILTLSFTGLKVISRAITIFFFICAFSTKFNIITKKLKEFGVPLDKYWEKYDSIKQEVEAQVEDQKVRDERIKRELDEVYYATLIKATKDTEDHYNPAMHKLNRYITFSFFNILIVLFNIGFNEFFSWCIIFGIFIFPFDMLIILILIYGMIVGFDKTAEVKDFFKKLSGPLIWIKSKIKK